MSLLKYNELHDRIPVDSWARCNCSLFEQGRSLTDNVHLSDCPVVKRANLVSSETPWGEHRPVIDLAVPMELVPSTKGQHLYIQYEMSWPRYATLLTAMKFAGVIETGFWIWSLRRRATFVRPPGREKTEEEYRRGANVRWGWLLPIREKAHG